MGFLDIFNKQKEIKNTDKIENTLSSQSMEDLMFTLTYYHNHTLSGALIQAARIINLIDPDNKYTFNFQESDFDNQNEKAVIKLAKELADNTRSSYRDDKKIIDKVFKLNIN